MISKEQIEHIAKLARMELTEEEKEGLTKDLSSILDYVEKLNEVNTSKINGISQVTGLENIVRNDESRINLPVGPLRSEASKAGNQELREKLLKEAPKRKGDYVQVPKILE